MTSPELHARLLDDARNYNPAAHHRSLFEPFRDVILLQRAKFMSYEKIAGTLTCHGVKASGPGVAVYCRRTFTAAEVERLRHQLRVFSCVKCTEFMQGRERVERGRLPLEERFAVLIPRFLSRHFACFAVYLYGWDCAGKPPGCLCPVDCIHSGG